MWFVLLASGAVVFLPLGGGASSAWPSAIEFPILVAFRHHWVSAWCRGQAVATPSLLS